VIGKEAEAEKEGRNQAFASDLRSVDSLTRKYAQHITEAMDAFVDVKL